MATEKRLIDAYALAHKMFYVEEKQGGHGWVISLEDLTSAPVVDVEQVVHGRWIYDSEPFCSECNETAVFTSGHYYHCGEYCPNCGAKMDGDGNG